MLATNISNNFGRVLAAVTLVIAVLAASGCGEIFSRDDFEKSVMGKSEKEVVSKAGKPAAVDSSNAERVIWTYHKVTFDLQNREDARTLVIFERKGAGGALQVAKVEFPQ